MLRTVLEERSEAKISDLVDTCMCPLQLHQHHCDAHWKIRELIQTLVSSLQRFNKFCIFSQKIFNLIIGQTTPPSPNLLPEEKTGKVLNLNKTLKFKRWQKTKYSKFNNLQQDCKRLSKILMIK